MSIYMIIVLILVSGACFVVGFWSIKSRRVNPDKYMVKWQDLQKLLKSKETWPLAIITADKLLDEALRNRHLKGRSMGERLVSAQHTFSDNDGVWYAHNLAKKLIDGASVRLRQVDVKKSLVGIRQALRDLGALQ